MKAINRTGEKSSSGPGGSAYPGTVQGSRRNDKAPRKRNAAMIVPDDYTTLINRNYVYEFASNGYCSILGKARQDVVDAPAVTVWGGEIFDEIIKKCLDKCFAGEKVNYEGWMEFPGRGLRYYQLFHHPYTSEQGEVTHVAVALRDITGIKGEEDALSKSEYYFRAALKSMHFGVYSFDTEGRFTFVNDVVVERTGYSREWFVARSLFEFVRPEERDQVRAHFEDSVRGVPVLPYEFAYYKASGETAWVQVNTTPMWDKGRIVGVLGVLLDITKRKQSEEALVESEAKYRRLFEDSKDAIFITDRRGMLTDANTSFFDLLGYAKQEAIGLDVIDMHVNHDDRDTCVRAMNVNGFIKDYQVKLKKKDGTPMDCLLTGTVRRIDDGAVAGYQGIVRDESDRKRMEEALYDVVQRLNSVISGSPVPQFIIDRDHTVTHWNRALEAVTGIRAEMVQGTKEHWKAFYRTERPCMADLLVDEAQGQIDRWYSGNGSKVDVTDGEYKVIHFFPNLGGGGKWLQFTTVAIRDSGGTVIGAVETLQDVTDRMLAEDTIQKTEERCRRLLETVSGTRQTPATKDSREL